jgi:hypothetical protein
MTNNTKVLNSKKAKESLEAMTMIIDALKDSPEHIERITNELEKGIVSAVEMGSDELAETYLSLIDRIKTKDEQK